MLFSVHNAYLHMTNVNTTEDKRITPPPIITILALYRCVLRKCACICTHPVFVHRRVHAACFRERTKTPSGPVTECASMKHFCHSQVPF